MTLQNKRRALQAAAILIGAIIVVRYFMGFGTDWRYIIAYSINPLNILFYFLDIVTIVLVILAFVLLAVRNMLALQAHRQWREAHATNAGIQAEPAPSIPEAPTISITNDQYMELLVQQSVTLNLTSPQLELAERAGEVIVRHEDDYGQFMSVKVESVTDDTVKLSSKQ